MRLISTWLIAVATLLTAAAASAHAQQDAQTVTPAPADPGEALFGKKCAQCHSLAKGRNGNGPSLHRIIDRRAASEPGFKYSRAMRQMAAEESLDWSEENLTVFLERPSLLVPGTRMAFPGIQNEDDLAALVAWIKANSGPPSDRP